MSAPKKPWSRDRFYPIEVGGVDKSYPSVTTILDVIEKPALKAWAARVERVLCVDTSADAFEELGGRQISRPSFHAFVMKKLGAQYAMTRQMRDAAGIGTLVHNRIEWELRSELGLRLPKVEPVIPEEDVVHGRVIEHPAHQAYGAYKKWRVVVRFRPRFMERKVWSHRYAYAGTLDTFGDVEDRPTVIDWKTAVGVFWEMKLQLSAYCNALAEMGEAGAPLHAMVVRLSKTDGDFDPHPVPWEEHEALFTAFRRARMLWQSRYEHEQA